MLRIKAPQGTSKRAETQFRINVDVVPVELINLLEVEKKNKFRLCNEGFKISSSEWRVISSSESLIFEYARVHSKNLEERIIFNPPPRKGQ